MANTEKSNNKILGRIAEIVKSCPYFGEYDWCQDHCSFYKFCDDVYETQKAKTQKPIVDAIKDAANRIFKESAEPIVNEML